MILVTQLDVSESEVVVDVLSEIWLLSRVFF